MSLQGSRSCPQGPAPRYSTETCRDEIAKGRKRPGSRASPPQSGGIQDREEPLKDRKRAHTIEEEQDGRRGKENDRKARDRSVAEKTRLLEQQTELSMAA